MSLIKTLRKKVTGPIFGLGILASLAGCGINPADKTELQAKANSVGVGKNYLTDVAVNSSVPADSLAQYNPRFFDKKRTDNIMGFDVFLKTAYERGITPSVANAYDERFSFNDIWNFQEMGIKAETANPYAVLGKPEDVIGLIRNRVPVEEALKYDRNRFSLTDILHLYSAKISGDVANAYARAFSSPEIMAFNQVGISSNDVNRYISLNERFGVKIDSRDIIYFRVMGVSYETIAKIAHESMLEEMISN